MHIVATSTGIGDDRVVVLAQTLGDDPRRNRLSV
jgi:hypothetical protein